MGKYELSNIHTSCSSSAASRSSGSGNQGNRTRRRHMARCRHCRMGDSRSNGPSREKCRRPRSNLRNRMGEMGRKLYHANLGNQTSNLPTDMASRNAHNICQTRKGRHNRQRNVWIPPITRRRRNDGSGSLRSSASHQRNRCLRNLPNHHESTIPKCKHPVSFLGNNTPYNHCERRLIGPR